MKFEMIVMLSIHELFNYTLLKNTKKGNFSKK